MARLALSKLGLSGNLLKTSIDWPRLDKAGPGWTRPAWAGQGQWKSPFRVVDWPGPAWAGLGLARPALFSDFYWPGLAWAGPGRPCPVWASPGQPGLARASPARPLFCTGRFSHGDRAKKGQSEVRKKAGSKVRGRGRGKRKGESL